MGMFSKAIKCIIPVLILWSAGGDYISGAGKPRFSIGVGFAETINAGLKFRSGGKTQMGISLGTWPSPGSYIFDWNSLISLSGDFYYHFGRQAFEQTLPCWYVRSGIDYMRLRFDDDIDSNMELHIRFGRDFYISEISGIGLDAGVAVFVMNESGLTPVLPAIGINLFFLF